MRSGNVLGKPMATHRYVQTKFWNDVFILGLTPEEKYFYLYIMTNPHSKQCGVYELPMPVMVFETGYNQDTLTKLINRFRDYKKLDWSEETNEIIILNWPKFNLPKSEPVYKCVQREMLSIKNNDFHDKMLAQIIKNGYPIHTLPIPHRYPPLTELKELNLKELKEKDQTQQPRATNQTSTPIEKILTSTSKKKNNVEPIEQQISELISAISESEQYGKTALAEDLRRKLAAVQAQQITT